MRLSVPRCGGFRRDCEQVVLAPLARLEAALEGAPGPARLEAEGGVREMLRGQPEVPEERFMPICNVTATQDHAKAKGSHTDLMPGAWWQIWWRTSPAEEFMRRSHR